MNGPLRIAIFSDFSLQQVTGVSDSLKTLIEALEKHGHTVCVFEPSFGSKQNRTHVVSLPGISLPGAPDMRIVLPFGAARALKKFRPDVLHVQTFGLVGLGALRLAKKQRLPLVGTDHTLPAEYLHYAHLDFRLTRTWIKKFAAWFYRHCDIVTTPSHFLKDELQTYGMTKPVEVVSNPVDGTLFRPLPDRDLLKRTFGITGTAFLSFGRLAKEKNIDALLHAFAQLCQRQKNTELVIIGDGPERTHLTKLAQELGIADVVRFLGVLRGETLVQAINATDVYVIASPSENQSMTTLQAKACGLPVIVTDEGGSPELVQEGVTGYIVPGDNIGALTKRMEELCINPKLRADFGERNRSEIERFSLDAIVRQMEHVYRTAIEIRSAGKY